jgi:hypothetical protein
VYDDSPGKVTALLGRHIGATHKRHIPTFKQARRAILTLVESLNGRRRRASACTRAVVTRATQELWDMGH